MKKAKVKSVKTVRRSRLANAPVKAPSMKKTSEVPATRVQSYLRSRFNPIRLLTPELLAMYLDRFKIGYLREIALVWDSIEERDDKVMLCRGLRLKSVARYGYQIEIEPNLDDKDKAQAEKHKTALESFYANLTTTSAIDENEKGGVKTLVRQMMDAVGKKYSVHEIVWQPTSDGLRAQFRWTPLWFFENTIGKLRFLPSEGEITGEDLDEGGWMITVGEGLMFATSIAYTLKKLPLGDWVTFCERNGMGAFLGKTPAPQGSPQFEALVEAVGSIAADYAAVMSNTDSIELLDLKGSQANLPYEPLVDRMDKAIAGLWRGGDLSTKSSGKGAEGHGSDRQADEADVILESDVELINETLHLNVTKYVIEYLFGDDRPLARFAIIMPPQQATAQDLAIDTFLAGYGVELGVEDARKRYGRVAPAPGEQILVPPPTPTPPANLPNDRRFANTRQAGDVSANAENAIAKLIINATPEVASALALTFKPLRERFQQALRVPDVQLKNSVTRFIGSIPSFLKEMNVKPELVEPLCNTYAAAFLNGRVANPPKTAQK